MHLSFWLTALLCTQSAAAELNDLERQFILNRAFSKLVMAERLTAGGNFSIQMCAKAMPLLTETMELWAQLSEEAADDDLARYLMGSCLLSNGDYSSALMHFEYIIQKPKSLMLSDARLKLADMYADGKGVARNQERALELYMLADPPCCKDKRHRERAAAEIMLALGSTDMALIQSLLERESAANWLRSLSLRKERNPHPDELLYLGLKALSATKDFSDREELAAYRAISLDVGQALLAKKEPALLPAAFIYLQRAFHKDANQLLDKLDESLPYQIVLPDGSPWSYIDGQFSWP